MLLGVIHEGRDGVVSMATSAEIGQSTVSVDFHGDHSTPAVLSHLKHFKKWVTKVYKSSSIKIMKFTWTFHEQMSGVDRLYGNLVDLTVT